MLRFNLVKDRSTNQARAGVTGHNVRYVLAFGLLGIIVAFAAVGFFYWGSQPAAAPPEVSAPSSPQPAAPAHYE